MESVIIDELGIARALTRISHEIIEKNESDENICIVGIRRRGVVLGKLICANLEKLGAKVSMGELDITLYRDDLSRKSLDATVNETKIDFDVNGKIVVIVDDVIYTGRTARAAIDAVLAFGRPAKIQLAVLVDRGHRELPIRPDFVGKNIPTSKTEVVKVCVPPYDSDTKVRLIK